MTLQKKLLIIFIIIFIPSVVLASGGGPLLLLFNSTVFIIGQVWIIGIELVIYTRMVKLSRKEAFKDILITNVLSTLLFAFIIPLIIAVIGLAGNFIPGSLGQIMAAIGTWVNEGSQYGRLALSISFFWFVLLYVATVFFEAKIIKRRWEKRSTLSNSNPVIISWYMNSVSYAGLLVAILVIWHELL